MEYDNDNRIVGSQGSDVADLNVNILMGFLIRIGT